MVCGVWGWCGGVYDVDFIEVRVFRNVVVLVLVFVFIWRWLGILMLWISILWLYSCCYVVCGLVMLLNRMKFD